MLHAYFHATVRNPLATNAAALAVTHTLQEIVAGALVGEAFDWRSAIQFGAFGGLVTAPLSAALDRVKTAVGIDSPGKALAWFAFVHLPALTIATVFYRVREALLKTKGRADVFLVGQHTSSIVQVNTKKKVRSLYD